MRKFFIYIFVLFSFSASAFDEFLITDIRIVGLQRVSIGSIFTAIPVSVGDKMNQSKVSEISRALFSTAQFNDIQIGKDGNALIISVVERPSISSIETNFTAGTLACMCSTLSLVAPLTSICIKTLPLELLISSSLVPFATISP